MKNKVFIQCLSFLFCIILGTKTISATNMSPISNTDFANLQENIKQTQIDEISSEINSLTLEKYKILDSEISDEQKTLYP